MSHILGVKFREAGQVYYFDSGPFVVSPGDSVIVNTEQGYGLGAVVLVCDELPADAEVETLKPIYRVAAQEDLEKQDENIHLAREAFTYCRECIRERKLEMKLVDVEVFFDRSKIIFYFTAPNRIDFRELVKDLVRNYRTRIELRQIGVRHETQMVGAVGNCGQVCCCRRFLRKFAPVTIRMAKEQNLFLNPTKISGMCGRLLCCLSYEQSNYEEFHRNCPKVGKKYITTDGPYKVLRANLFRNSLSVIRDGGEEQEMELEEWAELQPRRPEQHELQERKADRPAQNDAPSHRDKPRDKERGASAGNGGRTGSKKRPASSGADSTQGAEDASAQAGQMRASPEQDATHAPRESQPAEAKQGEGQVEGQRKEPGKDQGQSQDQEQKQDKRQGKRKRSRPRNRKNRQGQSQEARPSKDASKDGEQGMSQARSSEGGREGAKEGQKSGPKAGQKDGPKDKPSKSKRKRRRKPKPKQGE